MDRRPEILPPREIFTGRLYLRVPTTEDAEWIFYSYASVPEATRFLSWKTHESLAETIGFLHCVTLWWHEGGPHLAWLIECGTERALVGSIGVDWHPPVVTVGYVISPQYWNQGIATEALLAVNRWCLAQKNVFRVQAFHDVDNPASGRVMAKAGMVREGTLRRWHVSPNLCPEPRDCVMWSHVKPSEAL